jgi:acyl carrier protein
MEIPDLERRVKQILTSRLGIPPDEITVDAKLADDLGMDSLDAVELAIATERQFDVAVSDEQLAKLTTVADIMALVQRLADEQGGPGRGGSARSPDQSR